MEPCSVQAAHLPAGGQQGGCGRTGGPQNAMAAHLTHPAMAAHLTHPHPPNRCTAVYLCSFLPPHNPCPQIREKYKLHLPPYPGVSQCVRIGGSGRSPAAGPANVADMRMGYGAAGQSLDESDVSGPGLVGLGSRLVGYCWLAGVGVPVGAAVLLPLPALLRAPACTKPCLRRARPLLLSHRRWRRQAQ